MIRNQFNLKLQSLNFAYATLHFDIRKSHLMMSAVSISHFKKHIFKYHCSPDPPHHITICVHMRVCVHVCMRMSTQMCVHAFAHAQPTHVCDVSVKVLFVLIEAGCCRMFYLFLIDWPYEQAGLWLQRERESESERERGGGSCRWGETNGIDSGYCVFCSTGTPVNRIPIMAKQVLDLYTLYKLVTEKGGLVEVINKKIWREITKGLNLPTSITSAAFTLRTQ